MNPPTEISNVKSPGSPSLNGWHDINGTRRYYENDVMHTGWIADGPKPHYFGESGKTFRGWKFFEANWFYFAEDGLATVNY
ncbi:hypothetical protein [Schaalia vaccimaxillae]|uniref:hypothetical protein n=1 Tax=Schaalia vaccimaxillae TaxID=183916 RepID=UPI0003B5A491|nr:hypothetical protein [Schaalia vaccimaxillae]